MTPEMRPPGTVGSSYNPGVITEGTRIRPLTCGEGGEYLRIPGFWVNNCIGSREHFRRLHRKDFTTIETKNKSKGVNTFGSVEVT